jgi:uncharacterized SAM-binding protein YcdF (DUF218 family)
VQRGVPREHLLVEDESLHTRENAEYVLKILKTHNMRRVILVTSPFHQLRTFLTMVSHPDDVAKLIETAALGHV